MRESCVLWGAGISLFLLTGLPQRSVAQERYKVSKVVRIGGEGTFDTAFADVEARQLYIPRKNPGRVTVFNLDTLEPVGEIPNAAANGVVVDPKSGHGFASSKPVVMWDTKTLKPIKTIDARAAPMPSCSILSANVSLSSAMSFPMPQSLTRWMALFWSRLISVVSPSKPPLIVAGAFTSMSEIKTISL